MVEIPVSETTIQNRIKIIFDFVNETSNTEPVDVRLNHAWYELFGMKSILTEATNAIFTDANVKQEFDRIWESLTRALLDIEHLYDQAVDGQKHLNCF